MKTIILCGGIGTRMKEETEFKPKPLIKIGEEPILLHIMKIYAHFGFKEFILPLGYKGEMIKEYFEKNPHDFKIHPVDTGLESLTGERVLRIGHLLSEDNFMVTYGDGVSDINISNLIDFHKRQNTLGTISGVHPYAKYGLIQKDSINLVTGFFQKPQLEEYVSGGFMIFKKEILNFLNNGNIEDCFPELIRNRQLSVYEHDGFWKSMDTYKEMEEMNELWRTTRPWDLSAKTKEI